MRGQKMKRLFILLIFGIACSAMNIQEEEQESHSLLQTIDASNQPAPLCDKHTKFMLGITGPLTGIACALTGAASLYTLVTCTDPDKYGQCKNEFTQNILAITIPLAVGCVSYFGCFIEFAGLVKKKFKEDRMRDYYDLRDFADNEEIEVPSEQLRSLLQFQQQLEMYNTPAEHESINQLADLLNSKEEQEEYLPIPKQSLAYCIQAIRRATDDCSFHVGDTADGSRLTVTSLENRNQTITGPILAAWLEHYKNEDGRIKIKLKPECTIYSQDDRNV